MLETQPPAAAVSYLKIVTVGMIAFGAAMVLSPLVSEVLFNWMIFGQTGTPDGFTETASDFVTFSHGVMGAVMVGWFVLVLWLVRGPLAWGMEGTWTALTASLLGWYLLDSTYSLVEGYWQNAVLNTIVIALYVPGLWLTRAAGTPRLPARRTARPAAREATRPASAHWAPRPRSAGGGDHPARR